MSNCPQSTWKALVELTQLRDQALAREEELIRARDALKTELHELGSDQRDRRTTAYLKRTADFWESLEGITACRRKAQHISDKIGEAIKAGMQGKLFEFDQAELEQPLPKAPLFDGSQDGEDAAPIGTDKPAPAAKSEPPTGGIDQPIAECTGIGPAAVRDLREIGIITLSDFAKFMQEQGGDIAKLPKGVHISDFEALTAKVQAVSGKPAEPAAEKKTKPKKTKAAKA